jgi:hypothetical protein
MRTVATMGPAGAAGVGVPLVNYEMQAPAMRDVLGGDLSRSEAFVALALFIAVAYSNEGRVTDTPISRPRSRGDGRPATYS